VAWTEGHKTLTVAQLVKKFPTFEVSSLRWLNSVRNFTYSFNRKISNHYKMYLKAYHSAHFLYSNYVFDTPTKCTYTIKYMYYYQHSPTCFGA
jgi:hypothetical protein